MEKQGSRLEFTHWGIRDVLSAFKRGDLRLPEKDFSQHSVLSILDSVYYNYPMQAVCLAYHSTPDGYYGLIEGSSQIAHLYQAFYSPEQEGSCQWVYDVKQDRFDYTNPTDHLLPLSAMYDGTYAKRSRQYTGSDLDNVAEFQGRVLEYRFPVTIATVLDGTNRNGITHMRVIAHRLAGGQ